MALENGTFVRCQETQPICMRLKKLHRPGGESFCTLLTHSQCTSEGTRLIVISNSHLVKARKSQVFNYFNILALLNYSLETLSTGNSYSWFTFQLVQRSKESWKSSKATLLQLVLQLWCASSGTRGNCLLSSRKSLHTDLGQFFEPRGSVFLFLGDVCQLLAQPYNYR